MRSPHCGRREAGTDTGEPSVTFHGDSEHFSSQGHREPQHKFDSLVHYKKP